MNHRSLCIILLGWVAIASGCDRGGSAPVPSPAPAKAPATGLTTGSTTAPTIAPAPPEPKLLDAVSVSVGDESYLLPPMVLRFRQSPADPTADLTETRSELLLSGHEKAEPTGNSLILNMTSAATTPDDLLSMPWSYQALDDQWTDTTQGLSLDDERFILRPYDVLVRFAPDRDRVTITITGSFLRFDTLANPQLPGKVVAVEAQFVAGLVVQ
ncbi:MAG: hypothetical protein IT448_07030 [Phycisphaerales bacterium]|nr:hypothetical protein [Phycisphaerales bacterium]